jgi:hypothetical protein
LTPQLARNHREGDPAFPSTEVRAIDGDGLS